jgi:hypothetical protein
MQCLNLVQVKNTTQRNFGLTRSVIVVQNYVTLNWALSKEDNIRCDNNTFGI